MSEDLEDMAPSWDELAERLFSQVWCAPPSEPRGIETLGRVI